MSYFFSLTNQYFLQLLLGIRSTDPFVLQLCVSALLIANQRWGSHCHAHRSYCFMFLFSMVTLIYISRH